ncbi:MAG TPA: ribose ABC transporter substrate-binding protein RbsB [Firmicutes bacterium]|jgi:ribose transport system substrate-binding protein|nr:ribose ABC transporter substrate-binding protein RbsB [Bacillota bacterium]
MKKIIVLLMVVCMAVSLFSGLTFATAKPIGIVLSTLDNPFFVTLRDGAAARAKKLGCQLIVLDSQNDSAKESSNMEDLIQQKVGAILVNPVDSDAVVNAVKAANNAKIPVLTIDRTANGGSVVTHIASDNIAGGKMAGEYIVKLLKGKGKVVEIQGTPGASAARDRGKGFDGVIAKTPGIKIVAQQEAGFDRQKGLTVMENILQAQPVINAIFCQNDEMALGAIKAIQSAKRTGIIVVGFDATDDGVKAINAGLMTGTIAQQPAMIGSMGIDNAVNVMKGKKVPAAIPVALKLIIKTK